MTPSFNQEQKAAFYEMLQKYNASVDTPLSNDAFCDKIITDLVDSQVKIRYDKNVKLLGDMFSAEDFENRSKVIQINSMIAQLPEEEKSDKINEIITILK